MAQVKILCPVCGRSLEYDEAARKNKIKCPQCKHLIPVPQTSVNRVKSINRRTRRKTLLMAFIPVLGLSVVAWTWIFQPASIHWPDRRPIGVLFLASNFYSSATNPRGWFNDPSLDVTGPDGLKNFRKALLDYTDRSIAILKRTGAQGAIVWDLEGEEFPHKTTYIGDPRLLGRLAPEMAGAADEFFGRLRSAGFRVGLTVRPQRLIFDDHGQPRQVQVLDIKKLLLEKIDYARTRWGATMFYVDSNGGIFRPDEVWQLRRLTEQRPDILLIPEHHYLSYSAFSAPYVAMRKGDVAAASGWTRKLFPGSFQAVDMSDDSTDGDKIAALHLQGNVLLFRAWFWNPECQMLESFAHERQ